MFYFSTKDEFSFQLKENLINLIAITVMMMNAFEKISNWFEFVYSYQTGVIFMTNMIDQSQSCLSILLHCLEYKWIDLCNVTSPCVYR